MVNLEVLSYPPTSNKVNRIYLFSHTTSIDVLNTAARLGSLEKKKKKASISVLDFANFRNELFMFLVLEQ